MNDRDLSSVRLSRYYLPILLKKNTWVRAIQLKYNFMLELKTISNHLANIFSKKLNREVAPNTPEKLRSINQFIVNASSSAHMVACILSENDMVAKALFDILDNKYFVH